jgi:hypothetical protein
MDSRGIGVEFAHIAYTMVVNTGICLLLLLLAYGKVANWQDILCSSMPRIVRWK